MIVDVCGSASHIRLRNSSDCEMTTTIYYGKPLNPIGKMFGTAIEKNYLIPVRKLIYTITLAGTKNNSGVQ
jgi:hypothetical protein